MVKKIVLFDKFQNILSEKAEKNLIFNYLKYVDQFIKDFTGTKVKIKKLRNFDKRFVVEINGPDEAFIMNLLQKEIGTITEFNTLKVGQELKGTMVDVGKVGFGIFVDCAILNPKTDILISLITLRKQLCNGKEKSTRDIINAYRFIDNFPIFVKIIEIDSKNNKIQGEIAKKSLELFKKILDEKIEAILASGATKNQLKKSLIKMGHLRDIVSITRFSFQNNIVLFKENTNAPGIISNIGKNLKNCKLVALRYQNMEKLLA